MSKTSMRIAIKTVLPPAIILCILISLGIFIYNSFGDALRDATAFRNFLGRYGSQSAAVFIGFQAVQVVVAFIPGEPVQIAGGYVFGTLLGTIYSVVGTTVGAIIAFFAARKFGTPIVMLFGRPEKIDKFKKLMSSKNGYLITFLVFLIPGIPKDLLIYVAGITPIRPLYFFIIYTAARVPGNLVSSYMGNSIGLGNHKELIIIAVSVIIFFVAGIIFREKIIKWLENMRK